jgi:hypothetical protein
MRTFPSVTGLTVLLALCACGGKYDGTYAGVLSGTLNCDNGASMSNNPTVSWDVTTQKDALVIDPHGTCGTFTGTLFETSGTISAKTCNSTSSITGGRLSFSATQVIVTLDTQTNISGPNCEETLSGTLERK